MLTQLSRLSVEADGRYAKSEELQFLLGFFQSLEQRVSAYEKIKNSADEIINQAEAKIRAIDSNLFRNASGDFTETWRKDSVRLLRYSAAALLFNEQEHLRSGLLLWHNTIAKSYKFNRTCKTALKVIPEVVKQYLTPEEATLFSQIWDLNQIVLGSN